MTPGRQPDRGLFVSGRLYDQENEEKLTCSTDTLLALCPALLSMPMGMVAGDLVAVGRFSVPPPAGIASVAKRPDVR